MMEAQYVPIRRLKLHVPYRIDGVSASDGRITLYMREYDCSGQIETRLLVPRMVNEFRRVKEINRRRNGEASPMHLKYYGTLIYADEPVIRISCKHFVAYL
jgi:hypothetical protein